MLGTTHQIGGVCSAVVLGTFLFPAPLPLVSIVYGGAMIAGASFGSLLPDIDHPKSKISKKAQTPAKLLSFAVGHRGWTHTLLVFFFISALLFWTVNQIGTATVLLNYLVFGFSIGYASHLLLDALTVSGIPVFKPFSEHSFRLAKLRTGVDDPGVQFILIVMTIGVVYLQYFN